MTAASGVDVDVLADMARLLGDDVTAQVVGTFLSSCGARARTLSQAASQGGRPLRDAAHALTAASATVGALRLADLCWEVETSAESGDDDGARSAAHQALAEIDVVVAALESSQWCGPV